MPQRDSEPGPSALDGDRAVEVALDAAAMLMELRSSADPVDHAFDADALRRAGDVNAHESILRGLAAAFPGDVVLSEEGRDPAQRLGAERVWIVDPLDGTREFGECTDSGAWRSDFAIHLALWERTRGLTFGAVVLPALGTVYRSDRPASLPNAATGPIRVAVSRTRPPEFLRLLEGAGEVTLVPSGSAGYKATALLRGEVDAYVHAGGQYQWDSAAPVAVVAASGCIATRLDGSELSYNAADLSIPDLYLAHPGIAHRLRGILDRVLGGSVRGGAE